MSTPILSQDEIEALLRRGNTPSPSEELQDFLQLARHQMTAWVKEISGQPLEIEGPYVERLGKGLEQSFPDDAFVVAVDLGASELMMIMSAIDAARLGTRFGTSPQEAVQKLCRAWTAEIAQLLGASHRVYQVQEMTANALGQLTLPTQSYLVRHLLKHSSDRLEFCMIVQNGEGFEVLVREAMEQFNLAQAREASQGRLLKGKKSKSPVTRAVFTPIDQIAMLEEEQGITLLEDIDLTITVELGHTSLTLNEILELQPQSVISLERQAGEPIDVYVNDTKVAKAEVVVLEENFGVRILEIVPKSQRLQGES